MTLHVDAVMTRDVTSLGPDLTLTEMDRVLMAAGISGAPVVEDERVVGVVSQTDVIRLLYAEQKRAQKVSDFYTSPFPIPISALEHLARDSREIADQMTRTRVRDIMTVKPQCVGPQDDIEDAARLMWREGFHRLPVVSGGHLEGILSALDLVRLVAERGLGPA